MPTEHRWIVWTALPVSNTEADAISDAMIDGAGSVSVPLDDGRKPVQAKPMVECVTCGAAYLEARTGACR